MMKRAIGVALQVTLLVGLATVAIGTIPASASPHPLDACAGANTVFPGNDDSSVGPVDMGFSLDFFNISSSTVYVNNNGNLTFTSANGVYTPGNISGASQPIIAPFWADVDTRNSNTVTYGTTTFNTHPAFCATWDGVGYYNQQNDKLNKFQVILSDRSDIGAGDFDIIFNYNQIQWETGQADGGSDGLGGSSAAAGYSDGGGTSLEFPGSGVNGGLLDSNPTTGLINNSDSGVPGYYAYAVRNGTPTGNAPSITSDDHTTFTEGADGEFTFAATGNPTPDISIAGTLPNGVDYNSSTDTLSGTPDVGQAGTYPLTVTASNGISPDAVQNFTLTVDPQPTGSISGTVYNDVNGDGSADGGGSLAPVAPGSAVTPFTDAGEAGVTVCLDADQSRTCDEGETSTTTAGDGTYSFSDLPAGTYHVQLVVPSGWHSTGELSHYDVSLAAGQNASPYDFFIQQDAGALTLTKTDSPDPVEELNPITYTLTAGNSGVGDVNDVVVTDNLPAGTSFDSASTTQGSCSNTATTVTCPIGTLSGGGSATVTIIVQAPNVTVDSTITNNASVSASNADTVTASADTLVQPNAGGSTGGDVPPDTTVPLTFTTSTTSLPNGTPAVNGTDNSSVSLIVPPNGPGGQITLDELPCAVAPCTSPASAAKDAAAQAAAANAKLVLGGVVFSVVPPPNYPNTKPFRVTLLYDVSLHPKTGPVFYFKPGVSTHEIQLPHCGTTPPNGGRPCVLTNAVIVSHNALTNGDWKVVVRISSDPRMHK